MRFLFSCFLMQLFNFFVLTSTFLYDFSIVILVLIFESILTVF